MVEVDGMVGIGLVTNDSGEDGRDEVKRMNEDLGGGVVCDRLEIGSTRDSAGSKRQPAYVCTYVWFRERERAWVRILAMKFQF